MPTLDQLHYQSERQEVYSWNQGYRLQGFDGMGHGHSGLVQASDAGSDYACVCDNRGVDVGDGCVDMNV